MRQHCRSPAALLALAALAAGCAAAIVAPGQQSRHPYPRLAAVQARALVARLGARVIILDVRTPEEFAAGHLPGAINLDVQRPDFQDCLLDLDWRLTYLVMCKAGRRSEAAAAVMAELEFPHVYDLSCGFDGWIAAGYDVEAGEPGGTREGFHP